MKKRTDEDIAKSVVKEYPNSLILKIYRVGNKKRIRVKFKCGVCDSICDAYLDNIIKNKGCRTCGINKYKGEKRDYTSEELENLLNELGFEWINKNDYINDTSSIITKCKKCGKMSHSNITARINNKRGCKKCMGLEKKDIEIFKQEVFELEGNNYTVLSNDYTKTSDKNILIKHEKCGNEYYVSRTNFLKDRRCPRCASSKGEESIIKFLDKNNIEYIHDQEIFKDLLGVKGGILRYDFYLPKYNLLIEFQGKQHERDCGDFGDFERQQEHDKRKREYAKNNNIQLLEIWYWDFDNIDKILSEELL